MIAVINLNTGNFVHEFSTGGVRYDDFASSGDLRTIYASAYSGVVATIDPFDWAITGTYGGFPAIQRMDVTDDYIFLAHGEDNSVSVVSRYNFQTERTLSVPAGPKSALLLPGGQYLYISCWDANVISVWNTQTWQEIDRISVYHPIGMMANDAGNKIYVARLDWAGGVVVLKY
jgi:DNA-binding beta-propeller fold protein YncE